MGIIKKLYRKLNNQKSTEGIQDNFTYEIDKKFEITGGAYFRQVFSFGKIECTYKKENQLYAVLLRTIHFSSAHDDGGWTDWQEETSTLVFDNNHWINNHYCFNNIEEHYVAIEIPSGVDTCEITRTWSIYSGWREDGEDSYHYIPITVHFNLDNLLSLPCIDDEIIKDGFLIINKELMKCNDLICTRENGYNLHLLEEKYNDIKAIKPHAFLGIETFSFNLPPSCKKIEEEAFIDCYFFEFIIPNKCNVHINENAFVNCTIEEIHCPKRYENIFNKIFTDSEIIITD